MLVSQVELQTLLTAGSAEARQKLNLLSAQAPIVPEVPSDLRVSMRNVLHYYSFDRCLAGFARAVEHLVDVSRYWSVKYGTCDHQELPHHEFAGFLHENGALQISQGTPVCQWAPLCLRDVLKKVS